MTLFPLVVVISIPFDNPPEGVWLGFSIPKIYTVRGAAGIPPLVIFHPFVKGITNCLFTTVQVTITPPSKHYN